jgi:hypothetical protein
MYNIKDFRTFLMSESVGGAGTIDANGSQIDCIATDWVTGKFAYISIVNKDSAGWILDRIGIFFDLDTSQMIKYTTEIQAVMLNSALKRDKYEYLICKNETTPETFNTIKWKELVDKDPTGAILKPGSSINIEEFKTMIKNCFPFIYFNNDNTSGLQ